MPNFNLADLIVCAVIIISVYISWKSGFVKTFLGFLSSVISLLLARFIVPMATAAIRETPFFDGVTVYVKNQLGIEDAFKDAAIKTQADIIQALPLPDFMKSSLMENNNAEIYDILNVSSFGDYIGGFIANIIVNILVTIIAFALISLVVRFLCRAIRLLARLPVISAVDRFLGAVVGFGQAIVLIWVVFTFLTLFFITFKESQIYAQISSSVIAAKLYEDNIILNAVLKIIGG